jgi:hypothetical protein
MTLRKITLRAGWSDISLAPRRSTQISPCPSEPAGVHGRFLFFSVRAEEPHDTAPVTGAVLSFTFIRTARRLEHDSEVA